MNTLTKAQARDQLLAALEDIEGGTIGDIPIGALREAAVVLAAEPEPSTSTSTSRRTPKAPKAVPRRLHSYKVVRVLGNGWTLERRTGKARFMVVYRVRRVVPEPRTRNAYFISWSRRLDRITFSSEWTLMEQRERALAYEVAGALREVTK